MVHPKSENSQSSNPSNISSATRY
uniref:Uncharacterized protein n=1 Tax=Arundo donax TaxID=35708 RepID=A0A0A9ANJ3_ARUDO